MPELLNPDLHTTLASAAAYVGDAIIDGETDISIPISGAFLNGFVFSCGRARRVGLPDDPTMEISLLGASRSSNWITYDQTVGMPIPDDRQPGHATLMRLINRCLSDLLRDTVSTGFSRSWNPEHLEEISGLAESISESRDFLDALRDDPSEHAADIDGNSFRRAAGHWIWIGRAG